MTRGSRASAPARERPGEHALQRPRAVGLRKQATVEEAHRAQHQRGVAARGALVVLREKRVSVTPLMLDLTDEPMRETVASWPVEGFVRHLA